MKPMTRKKGKIQYQYHERKKESLSSLTSVKFSQEFS
jgi:hypothetical protein